MSNETTTNNPKAKLMILDDEADIVKALTRVFRRDFEVAGFTEPKAALEELSSFQPSVILSDMRMPEMDGAEFFSHAREICPDAIRILLTGYADLEATTRAINQGGVYSYLSKPWDNNQIRQTVAQAEQHYALIKERETLQQALKDKNDELETVNQSLELKVQQRTMELRDSYTKLQKTHASRSALFKDVLSLITTLIAFRTEGEPQDVERVSHQCRMVAIELGLSDIQVQHTYLAAMLHKLGMVSDIESQVISQNFNQSHIAPSSNPVAAAELIGNLSRFKGLAEFVKHQDENNDGTGYPAHLKGDDIPVVSKIIRVVKDYDYLVTTTDPTVLKSPDSAINYLTSHCGDIYDNKVVQAFRKVLRDRPKDEIHDIEYCVGVAKLKAGDVVRRDLVLPNGTTLLTRGSEISPAILDKLKHYEQENRTSLAYFI
ncbi:HD domain-containing phosphohydrolase [Vibrio sp. SCSIO 43136]|uniref:HD domain-containing phosphohydrolase n=1 Tax=Vibrio sp. SCSIO 43136 TaxID=2819101 RepID=UPI0020755FC5|nr:HD domain-containing phosphohydrolase [Vibrio sp. SCSIO 43136]USD66784.1 response regulator [Vibrio sp. SCSIO 43136]